MATLYIEEYNDVGRVLSSSAQAPLEPSIASQTVAIGAATQSAAFSLSTTLVRVHVDAICSVAFGANPTATTSNKRFAAGQTEYFGVVPGHKLSVIANT